MLVSFKDQDDLDVFFDRFKHLEFHKTDSFSLIDDPIVHVMLSAEKEVLAEIAEVYNYVPNYQI